MDTNNDKRNEVGETCLKIKEILSTGEAYSLQELSKMAGCSVTTVKRVLTKDIPGVKRARFQTYMKGGPYSYWMSPSKYDDIDEPLTKLEVMKELLLSGERLSYLTFGDEENGDSTVYTYVERLRKKGWDIVKEKNGTGKAFFYLRNPETK